MGKVVLENLKIMSQEERKAHYQRFRRLLNCLITKPELIMEFKEYYKELIKSEYFEPILAILRRNQQEMEFLPIGLD